MADFQEFPGFGPYQRVEAYPMPDGSTRYVGFHDNGAEVLPNYTPPGAAGNGSAAPGMPDFAGMQMPAVEPGQAGAAEPPKSIIIQTDSGHELHFDPDTSPDVIRQTVAKLQGGNTVPLDKRLDEKTGAPWNVRAAVGAASQPQDRLATLQKFYPDAQPYGPDNFVFTHPRTNRPTLYNEKNPTLLGFLPLPTIGDIASIGPEIAEGVGGLLGGAGAAAFAPTTGGGSLLAIPAATGAGAAAARAAFEGWAQSAGKTVDTRSLPHRLADTAMVAGVNSLAGPAAEYAMRGARSIFGPVNDVGQQMLQRFRDAGVRPLAGAVTGNRGIQTLEHGIASTPGGAGVMMDRTRQAVDAVGERMRGLARQYAGGEPATAQGIGETAIAGARQAGERFSATRATLDAALERHIGSDTRVTLPAVRALRQDLFDQLSQAPTARAGALEGPLNYAMNILRDAGVDGVPFRALRSIRTDLGQMLDRPDVAGYTPAQMTALRRLYAALTEDIYTAARGAGPDAERALRLHDRYVRLNRNVNLPTLEAVNKVADNADAAYKLVTRWTREGGVELSRLRRSLTPQQWDVIAGSILHRLGTPKGAGAGITELAEDAAEFSAAKFLGRFADLSPEARRTIWGGSRYAALVPQLENLLKVARGLEHSARLANHSNTARALGVMTGIVSGTQYLMDGDPKKAGATVAVTVIAPHIMARLLTSPRFVQWLAYSMRTGSVANASARLGAIAEVEPGLRDAINTFYSGMQSAGIPTQ